MQWKRLFPKNLSNQIILISVLTKIIRFLFFAVIMQHNNTSSFSVVVSKMFCHISHRVTALLSVTVCFVCFVFVFFKARTGLKLICRYQRFKTTHQQPLSPPLTAFLLLFYAAAGSKTLTHWSYTSVSVFLTDRSVVFVKQGILRLEETAPWALTKLRCIEQLVYLQKAFQGSFYVFFKITPQGFNTV